MKTSKDYDNYIVSALSAKKMSSDSLNNMNSISEGGATVLYKSGEVFYNLVQIFNRDLSVMFITTWDEYRNKKAPQKVVRNSWATRGDWKSLKFPDLTRKSYEESVSKNSDEKYGKARFPPMRILEALSATGLRAVRYARELPSSRVDLIVANDMEATAVEAIRKNLDFNYSGTDEVAPVVANAGDANLVMQLTSRGLPLLPDMPTWMTSDGKFPSPSPFLFDVIDLDPYGSAHPFLDAAFAAITDGGLLAVTCTDMAVLAGNHQDACRNKYGALPVRGRHYNEQALRIALAAIETAANRQKKTIKPLLSVTVDFYLRVFVQVEESAQAAKEASSKLGMLHQCTGCDAFWLWPLARGGDRKAKGLWAPYQPAQAEFSHADESVDESGAQVRANASGFAAEQTHANKEIGSKRVRKAPTEGFEWNGRPPKEKKPLSQAAKEFKERHILPNMAPDLPCKCPYCGRSIVVGGPIWLDPIHNKEYVELLEKKIVNSFGEDGHGNPNVDTSNPWAPGVVSAKSVYHLDALKMEKPAHDAGSNTVSSTSASRRRLLGVVRTVLEEDLHSPLVFEVPTLSSRLRCSAIPFPDMCAALLNLGYSATASHTAVNAVKTNAPFPVILDIMRDWAGKNGKQVGAELPTIASNRSVAFRTEFVPADILARGQLPLEEALLAGERFSTDNQIPKDKWPISFSWPEELRERMRQRQEQKDRGSGQRFVPNPIAHGGPKARATGAKKEDE